MPGRYKEGTVHWEESRQRWRAFVSVDGRRYSKRFLSRDEALAWTQKMRLAAHDGSFVAPSAISLGEWLIKWLGTYKKPTVKPLTYERYLFTANKALPLAGISLQKLTPTMLQELYNALTPDCAKKLHVLLHGAIQKAWELGMVRKKRGHLRKAAPRHQAGERDLYQRGTKEDDGAGRVGSEAKALCTLSSCGHQYRHAPRGAARSSLVRRRP